MHSHFIIGTGFSLLLFLSIQFVILVHSSFYILIIPYMYYVDSNTCFKLFYINYGELLSYFNTFNKYLNII